MAVGKFSEVFEMNSLIVLIVGIVVVLGVLSVIRELVLWYWRINEHIEIAKESRDYLKEIAAATTYMARLASAQRNGSDSLPTGNASLSGWRESGDKKV